MAALSALFLAGLGLFFLGVDGIKANLQQLTSRRFRRILTRLTERPLVSMLHGFILGAATQSASAVAIILASLISSGLITTASALPIIGASNLGTTVLVLVASLKIDTAVYYTIGLTSLALTFNVAPRWRPAIAALNSMGLLFLGLSLMKSAFAPLPSFSWFAEVATFIQGSYVAVFILGILLRVAIQSSSAIVVIGITLQAGGLFSETQTLMLMAGTGIGVGLAVLLLSGNLSGSARQVTLFQAGINVIAGLTMFLLLEIELQTDVPLVHAFLDHLRPEWQMSIGFVVLQTICFLTSLAGTRFAPGWLARFAPATAEQDMAKPRYLNDQVQSDVETALILAWKEQVRLLGALSPMLEKARGAFEGQVHDEDRERMNRSIKGHAAAVRTLALEVKHFLRGVGEQTLDQFSSERLLLLERRQDLYNSLAAELESFALTLTKPALSAVPIATVLLESLDTILLTMADAAESDDADSWELTRKITADRGPAMERLRDQLASAGQEFAQEQRTRIYHLTTLFERAIWLTHQIVGTWKPHATDGESAGVQGAAETV